MSPNHGHFFQNHGVLTSSTKNSPAAVFLEISQEWHGRPLPPLFRCQLDTVILPCWCLQEAFLGVICLVLPSGSCSKQGLEMGLQGRVVLGSIPIPQSKLSNDQSTHTLAMVSIGDAGTRRFPENHLQW